MIRLRNAISKNERRTLICLLVIFLLAIWGTRLLTMGHEIALQPDEQVFFNSAASVVYDDYTFKQVRDYPNGAFVFQMPFQFAGRVFSQMFTQDASTINRTLVMKESGRIASIFYFSMGFLLGAVILWRNFGRRIQAVLLYCLIMLFSLFQIEQSRYGTGDAITFFVLMVIFYAIDLFLREENTFYLYFSAFCTGALMAVKFPLAFFIAYPCSALVLYAKQQSAPKKSLVKPLLLIILFFVPGLLLFSPQFFNDPAFFMKAFFIEMDAYMVSGNLAVIGTPLNHLVDVVLYQLLYADFPLALPIAIYGVIRLWRNQQKQPMACAFYTVVVPASLLLFFVYNLFAKTMFMRTFYPYFCLCIFYTAYGLSELITMPKARIAVALLTAVMAVRGSYFIYALSDHSQTSYIYDTLTSHEQWDERTMTVMLDDEFIAGGPTTGLPPRKYMYTYQAFINGVPEVKPGEFVITGPMAYGYAQKRIFPSGNTDVEQMCHNWEAFREENEPYLIGKPYPDAYNVLFGTWVTGTTLTHYEFPTNYLYYREHEDGAHAEKAKAYNALHSISDYDEYLSGLAAIDGCVVIVAKRGDEQPDVVDLLASTFSEGEEDGTAYYGNDILVIQSNDGVTHYEALEEERTIPLQEVAEIDCEILFKVPCNVFTVDGRSYTFYELGYSFVVYDLDLGCVMDWGALTIGEDGGIELSIIHDNRGNLAI